ncbi:LOW QUALITY PROTEIN: hypothetical protein PHMEG_0002757 [Phytophthora megakarya]|uniref:Uncharacterized protein n=1 Tax=Phytophthora megakarya TaxID=4795 RepID=A0A225WXZ6_9STRA|nr:LOW QUALITY PROTEIN: hypothetical protein PHMEG_0002757 [Phytophthora megakarya]
MWSMTGGATQHMQFAHALPVGMVFEAQGSVAQPETSFGVQVTEAVLPVTHDVVMSESGQAIIRAGRGHLGGTPTDEGQARAMILQRRRSEAPAFDAFDAVIQTVAKSVD